MWFRLHTLKPRLSVSARNYDDAFAQPGLWKREKLTQAKAAFQVSDRPVSRQNSRRSGLTCYAAASVSGTPRPRIGTRRWLCWLTLVGPTFSHQDHGRKIPRRSWHTIGSALGTHPNALKISSPSHGPCLGLCHRRSSTGRRVETAAFINSRRPQTLQPRDATTDFFEVAFGRLSPSDLRLGRFTAIT